MLGKNNDLEKGGVNAKGAKEQGVWGGSLSNESRVLISKRKARHKEEEENGQHLQR